MSEHLQLTLLELATVLLWRVHMILDDSFSIVLLDLETIKDGHRSESFSLLLEDFRPIGGESRPNFDFLIHQVLLLSAILVFGYKGLDRIVDKIKVFVLFELLSNASILHFHHGL